MAESKVERVVLRRKSFPVLSWTIMIVLGAFAVAAAGSIESGAARGPLIGVAACLGTIALVRRILCSRIVLGKISLKVVNPVFTYELPYRLVAQVKTATNGTLTVDMVDGHEVYATAFGGSLLDHFVGSSEKAATRLQEAVRQRRGRLGVGVSARRTLTVSWIADLCTLGAVGVLIAAIAVGG
ncbi:hypothetical protein ABZ611_26080 [Streptomyces sp. NPDC007861]|uniref:hypothetical protein n=1 Tax=Streptomyces sp. NPDC007861 TaxID=3154893 RepID=UPI0033CF4E4D